MKKIAFLIFFLTHILYSSSALSDYSKTVDKDSLRTLFNTFNLINYDAPIPPDHDRGFAIPWHVWYGKFYRANYNRVIAFAYPENDIKSANFSGFCMYQTNAARVFAVQNALKCCELKKDKSHKCSILFRNSDIVNKDYLAILNQ